MRCLPWLRRPACAQTGNGNFEPQNLGDRDINTGAVAGADSPETLNVTEAARVASRNGDEAGPQSPAAKPRPAALPRPQPAGPVHSARPAPASRVAPTPPPAAQRRAEADERPFQRVGTTGVRP